MSLGVLKHRESMVSLLTCPYRSRNTVNLYSSWCMVRVKCVQSGGHALGPRGAVAVRVVTPVRVKPTVAVFCSAEICAGPTNNQHLAWDLNHGMAQRPKNWRSASNTHILVTPRMNKKTGYLHWLVCLEQFALNTLILLFLLKWLTKLTCSSAIFIQVVLVFTATPISS